MGIYLSLLKVTPHVVVMSVNRNIYLWPMQLDDAISLLGQRLRHYGIRLEFAREGYFQKAIFSEQNLDTIMFVLTRTDWPNVDLTLAHRLRR